MTIQNTEGFPKGDTRGLKTGLWIAGLAAIVLGVIAILFPFAATLTAELLFGALLLVLGLFEIIRSVIFSGVVSRVWSFLFGLTALVAGGVLLIFPLGGALTLTLVVAVFLLLGGLVQLVIAWQASPGRRQLKDLPVIEGWGWLALSGALSMIIGGIVLSGLPGSVTWALGLLLGVYLLSLGGTQIAIAVGLPSDEGLGKTK